MECNFLMFTQLTSRRYPKLKEVDDVLGGAAAWDNVDKTKSELLNSFELLLSACLLYTSPSPRDQLSSRMPSSA